MTAAFVARYPKLFHVTDTAAVPGVLARGLLPAAALAGALAAGMPEAERAALLGRNRAGWTPVPGGLPAASGDAG